MLVGLSKSFGNLTFRTLSVMGWLPSTCFYSFFTWSLFGSSHHRCFGGGFILAINCDPCDF
ncbi:uncharacterized protein DS421_12g367480 [Arachis hypogaea]|nr:uncharacterized protein DS421_12g367480 [Arachis hypogaea]